MNKDDIRKLVEDDKPVEFMKSVSERLDVVRSQAISEMIKDFVKDIKKD